MANEKNNYDSDRFASGTRNATTDDDVNPDDMKPGVVGGGKNYVPETGRTKRESGETNNAASAENTIGAAGEMDATGAPASTTGASDLSGASSAGNVRGGGPDMGAATGGGAGAGVSGAGPQSVESTLAALGDRELSSTADPTGVGGSGAGGDGGAGGSDVAGDSAVTK